MTKRQAVETAVLYAMGDAAVQSERIAHNAGQVTTARLLAEHAFDLGRVAGMRGAALRALAHGCRIDHCPHCADAEELRDAANALARKLRDGRK